MSEFYEEFETSEEVQDDIFEVQDDEISNQVKEETTENNDSESGFTSKDVVEIIKAITGKEEEENSDSGSERISDPEEEVSSGDSDIVAVDSGSIIETYDYTDILSEIKNGISSGNAELYEQNYILGQLYDDSKPDSAIDNLSVTNLLLLCIFVLLLVDLLFKIIRGLF